MSPIPLFTSELVGTAILAFLILATTDKHNAAPDLSLLPVAVFILVLGLGVAWGMESMWKSASVDSVTNPVGKRSLSTRLATLGVG
jgi:glycerol uptake facilitator-like aquaporin